MDMIQIGPYVKQGLVIHLASFSLIKYVVFEILSSIIMFSNNRQVNVVPVIIFREQKGRNQDWHVCKTSTSSNVFTKSQRGKLCSF